MFRYNFPRTFRMSDKIKEKIKAFKSSKDPLEKETIEKELVQESAIEIVQGYTDNETAISDFK